jgi:hypothetical protein
MTVAVAACCGQTEPGQAQKTLVLRRQAAVAEAEACSAGAQTAEVVSALALGCCTPG